MVWCAYTGDIGVHTLGDIGVHTLGDIGVHTLGDCGVHTLGDTSAFVNPAGQLLLTRRVKGALYRIWCGVNRLADSVMKAV